MRPAGAAATGMINAEREGMRKIIYMLLLAVLPWAGAGAGEKPRPSLSYCYVSYDLLGVGLPVAEAVCAPGADTGWALDALNAELKSGQAVRLMSCGGVAGLQRLYIAAQSRGYFIGGYETAGHLAVPKVGERERSGARLAISQNMGLSAATEVWRDTVETTPAGDIENSVTEHGISLSRNIPTSNGTYIIRAAGGEGGLVGVAVVSVKTVSGDSPAKAEKLGALRLLTLQVQEDVYQSLRTSTPGFPFLSQNDKQRLLPLARMLNLNGQFERELFGNGSTVNFVGGYKAVPSLFREETAAPQILSMTCRDSVEITARDNNEPYQFRLVASAPPQMRRFSTKLGPLDLPECSSLEIGGAFTLARGEIIVLADAADPLYSAHKPLFAPDAARSSEAGSGAEGAAARGKPQSAGGWRTVFLLEALK